MSKLAIRPTTLLRSAVALGAAALFAAAGSASAASADREALRGKGLLLIGIGDSLTHGTMDATNNTTNTGHAYLQLVADALAGDRSLRFAQPFFDDETHERSEPSQVPSNLGVDGANLFTAEGLTYYKRVGAEQNETNPDYYCDAIWPQELETKYDKVIYPIDLLAGEPATQIDGVVELLERNAASSRNGPSATVFWLGNNDSSLAALGSGGANPSYLPLPYAQIADDLDPGLSKLLGLAEQEGYVSFAPYTAQAIDRNLTNADDFDDQVNHLLDRIAAAPEGAGKSAFVLTLPYYSAVGYLMDANDIEYYLRKLDPSYTVPVSFTRPDPAVPYSGARISLLTFGMMYTMLDTGASVAEVNSVLDVNGQQADGLVMSEAESATIRTRIDSFNASLANAVTTHGPGFHLIDVGGRINAIFAGETPVYVNGDELTRNWSRGQSFSLDGVHPGYTAQGIIANDVLAGIQSVIGGNAPAYDLDLLQTTDVYADNDGDGWVPASDEPVTGIAELLYLFRDPDDGSTAVQPVLPPDVWHEISRVLFSELLGVPRVKTLLPESDLGVRGSSEDRRKP